MLDSDTECRDVTAYLYTSDVLHVHCTRPSRLYATSALFVSLRVFHHDE